MTYYRVWPRQGPPSAKSVSSSTDASTSSSSTSSSTDTSTSTGTDSRTGTSTSPSTSSSGSSSPSTGSGSSTNTGTTTSGSSPSTTGTSSSSTSTTPTSTSTTSSSQTTNTLPPGVVTITSTQLSSNTPTLSPVSSSAASTSQGFFQNKAAVAGVFAVVGLIGLIILIALIMNCIRRRRAQEFDREIAEAAAEAAAARAPAFLDDENENYAPGYSGASAYGKYSDASHGTYGQPPMSEPYNMRQVGPSPGDIYDTSVYTAAGAAGVGAGAGAAGIGVARARSRRDGAFAAGLQEGTSPYPAFAGPQYNDVYNSSRTPPPDFRGTGSPDFDADPAVIGGAAATAVRRGFSQQTQQTGYSNVTRNRSANGLSSDGHSSSQVPLALQPRVQRQSLIATSDMVPTVAEDPSPSDPLPNPFSATTETHDIHEDQDESEEEEEQPRPVLRVANE